MSWLPKCQPLIVSSQYVSFVLLTRDLTTVISFAVVQENPAEEHRFVESELERPASSNSSSFWSNIDKSRAFLTLRTRVKQVSGVVGSCHAALCNIYGAMFPLNKQPQGIFAFMKEFCGYKEVKRLVRRQLIAGAKVALAVAKTHYPRLDYSKIALGPRAPTGRQQLSMTGRYEEAQPAAIALMRLAEEDTEEEAGRNRLWP